MTTKSNRHKMIEVKCEWCGIKFMARKQRVDLGLSRFCSKAHFDEYQRKNTEHLRGKEVGKKYWDKSRNRWVIHWKDDNFIFHVTGYARWWWEQNKGEISEGYKISYKDGNYENIDPSNFECILSSKAESKGGKNQIGIPKPTNAGANNKWWKGGNSQEYPLEFSRSLKKKIKMRDNYICQACNSEFDTRFLDVHHMDKDKTHNWDKNLITLCKSCHRAVHGKQSKRNDMITYLRTLFSD
jgi:hypothetical protein